MDIKLNTNIEKIKINEMKFLEKDEVLIKLRSEYNSLKMEIEYLAENNSK